MNAAVLLLGLVLVGYGPVLTAQESGPPNTADVGSATSEEADFQSGFAPTEVETGPLDAALAEDGWVLLQKRGVAPTIFSAADGDTIRVVANRSNALIFRPIAGVESARPHLSWQWRVDVVQDRLTLPTMVNPDWPLVIYAAFEVDKQYLGWWRRMVNRIVAGFAGLPESGNIVAYLYTLDESAAADSSGRFTPNPYIPKIGMQTSLRSGVVQGRDEPDVWFSERRDVLADFEAAFGYPAIRVLYIAISADSEDTESLTVARVRGLQLD